MKYEITLNHTRNIDKTCRYEETAKMFFPYRQFIVTTNTPYPEEIELFTNINQLQDFDYNFTNELNKIYTICIKYFIEWEKNDEFHTLLTDDTFNINVDLLLSFNSTIDNYIFCNLSNDFKYNVINTPLNNLKHEEVFTTLQININNFESFNITTIKLTNDELEYEQEIEFENIPVTFSELQLNTNYTLEIYEEDTIIFSDVVNSSNNRINITITEGPEIIGNRQLLVTLNDTIDRQNYQVQVINTNFDYNQMLLYNGETLIFDIPTNNNESDSEYSIIVYYNFNLFDSRREIILFDVDGEPFNVEFNITTNTMTVN